MFHFLAITGMLASLLSPAATTPITPTPRPHLDAVMVNGTGCPADTGARATVSPDGRTVTVLYDPTPPALVGVGAGVLDARKNCQISLLITPPDGWTYAVSSADYTGFAYLAPGATATERAHYYFQGSSQTLSPPPHTITTSGSWQFTDTMAVASSSYLPCGDQRRLNVNTEVRVSAGTSDTATTTSLVWLDSSATLHLSWKPCS